MLDIEVVVVVAVAINTQIKFISINFIIRNIPLAKSQTVEFELVPTKVAVVVVAVID